MQVSPGPDSTFIEKCFRWDGTSCVEKKAAIIKNGENFIADTYIYVCTTTVEPLYRGHHWDPAGCPVYSGTSL